MSVAIRTADQLFDVCEANIKWRRLEASSFINIARSMAPIPKKAALRAALAILYAHWEGLIKECSEAYLEYVSRQGLTHRQLQVTFAANSIVSKSQARVQGKPQNLVPSVHLQIYRETIDDPASITFRGAVKTRSNMNFSVFSEILYQLGIDEKPYVLSKAKIDEMVRYRNTIVHGEQLPIDFDYYNDLYRIIFSLLDRFLDDILEAALNSTYKSEKSAP